MNSLVYGIGDTVVRSITFPPESPLDIGLAIGGLIIGLFGIVVTRSGWQLRGLINFAETIETPTTIRDINDTDIDREALTELTKTFNGPVDHLLPFRSKSQQVIEKADRNSGSIEYMLRSQLDEQQVELSGTISGPVDGSGFVSPISQTEDSVFAKWDYYEWAHDDDDSALGWRLGDSGMYSVPFYLDDGTGRIQVAIDDCSRDVRWRFGDPHVTEYVSVETASPIDLTTFVSEHNLEGQSRGRGDHDTISRQHPSSDGTTVGDRHYAEWTLEPGDEIHLTGRAHGPEGRTLPRYSENMIVTPDSLANITSDRYEGYDEVSVDVSWVYRLYFIGSAILFVISAGLLIAGLTTLL